MLGDDGKDDGEDDGKDEGKVNGQDDGEDGREQRVPRQFGWVGVGSRCFFLAIWLISCCAVILLFILGGHLRVS